MVSTSWLLGCLARGAEAVGVLACDGDCPFEQQERIEGKVAYCQDLLGRLGGSPGDARLLRPSPRTTLAEALNRPLRAPVQRGDRKRQGPLRSGTRTAALAIQTLAEDYGSSPVLSFGHPFSPLGLVRIDSDNCTACGGCARACPTGALTFHQEDDAVSLNFDPALCTACQQCTEWCPEAAAQALRIDKVTDLHALSQGRVTLYQSRDVRCESCGAVIGPAAMLSRIETLLTSEEDANAATIATITRRCPSCRVAAASGSRPFPSS
jgi:ferredoxin